MTAVQGLATHFCNITGIFLTLGTPREPAVPRDLHLIMDFSSNTTRLISHSDNRIKPFSTLSLIAAVQQIHIQNHLIFPVSFNDKIK